MSNFILQLRSQSITMRKKGSNGLADLFGHAAEELSRKNKRINQLEKCLNMAELRNVKAGQAHLSFIEGYQAGWKDGVSDNEGYCLIASDEQQAEEHAQRVREEI